jgi:hypothetical protein
VQPLTAAFAARATRRFDDAFDRQVVRQGTSGRPRILRTPLLGGNHLKGRDGDRINAVLAAAGYNFSLLLRWFAEFLRALLLFLCHSRPTPRPAWSDAQKHSSRTTMASRSS